MKYKFRAKDIKTGEMVEGNLVYVSTVREKIPIKSMIANFGGCGGMLWARDRHVVDESTIELVQPKKNTYVLVEWPETQNLMDYEGFKDNACLANDDYFLETYGSSAYFVNEEWLKQVEKWEQEKYQLLSE